MNPRVLFIVLLLIAFLMAVAAPAAEQQEVSVKVDDKAHTIDFLAGKDLVTRYYYGPEVAKPYFWPLNGPGGKPLTRSWPMEKGTPGESTDHKHQKSAWFCHGDVILDGLELKPTEKSSQAVGIDFWSEEKGHGTIACTTVGTPGEAKNHGWVATENEWKTADGRKVLDEKRTLHLYDLGDARLLVLDVDLRATAGAITFGDTKEGSLGIRINDAIREEIEVDKKKMKGPGTLENAEGKKTEKPCWGYQSMWCDYSGPLDGKVVGLAILNDPKNPMPCWHSRGYGLMAANPFGREKSGFPAMQGKTELMKLPKDEHLKLRYGLLLHAGDAKEGKVADFYKEFTKLP
jgi:hypothetical protein